MRIQIGKATYKGVPGSSLSEFRCDQTVILYDFVVNRPSMDYVQIQKETTDLKLFQSRSVVRTFCPLLSNLHFVEYGDGKNFKFTEDGVLFVNALKMIADCKAIDKKTEKDKLVMKKLQQVKTEIIRIGIRNMYENPELSDNNLWVVFDLLKELEYLVWNEYFYGLYLIKEKLFSASDACKAIINNRKSNTIYEAVNEQGQPIADTQWSYMRSLLCEAELIEDYNNGSRLNINGINFLKEIEYGR